MAPVILRSEATLARLSTPEAIARSTEGLRGVVALYDLGALTAALDELLLGEEVVGEAGIKGPDRVQKLELNGVSKCR